MNSKLIGKQKGMTLIEIMVALMLGAFLLAGVMQIFLSSKQTYRMQDNMSRMQENGRFAMEFISRDIRRAGYWGCVEADNIENKLKIAPPSLGISGVDNDNASNAIAGNDDQDSNAIWDMTDTISFIGASSDITASLTLAGADLSADFIVTAGSQFALDDFAVISNCVSGDIFRITNNVAAGTTIEHATDPTDPAGNNTASLGFDNLAAPPDELVFGIDRGGSTIYRLNNIDYRIGLSATGEPVLDRNVNNSGFQDLVEGIEDMQILYGVDTDADGTPNYYVDADAGDGAGGNVVNMIEVVSVRVSLLVRSLDDNLASEPLTYRDLTDLYSTPPSMITATDRRLRRIFSSTIVLRNRLN